MKQYKVLILTDHANHSMQNSLYPLATAMLQHKLSQQVDIASRANQVNSAFFKGQDPAKIQVRRIDAQFKFTADGTSLSTDLKSANPADYDLIWLRLPPPLSKDFLDFVEEHFQSKVVINKPSAIYETGSKEFLIRFPELCPPLKICRTASDVISFKNQFPIVLKPFREYGGKGIVKIDGKEAWLGPQKLDLDDFLKDLEKQEGHYLGVKYLKNVGQGDKRIVVVNGKILGASLRLPPEDSWICNVAMGGSSHLSEPEEAEKEIIKVIDPVLSKMGIVMYGVDTLVGDDGKRVLSEINTTSIGGLPQIAALKKRPLVEEAIDLIWNYFLAQEQQAQ